MRHTTSSTTASFKRKLMEKNRFYVNVYTAQERNITSSNLEKKKLNHELFCIANTH